MKLNNIVKELKRVSGERAENTKRIKEIAINKIESALAEYTATIRNIEEIKKQALELGVSTMVKVQTDNEILDFIIYKAEKSICYITGLNINDLKIHNYIKNNNKENTESIQDIKDFNNKIEYAINELYNTIDRYLNNKIEDTKTFIKIKGRYYSEYKTDNNINSINIADTLNNIYGVIGCDRILVDRENLEILNIDNREVLGSFKVQKNGTLIISK